MKQTSSGIWRRTFDVQAGCTVWHDLLTQSWCGACAEVASRLQPSLKGPSLKGLRCVSAAAVECILASFCLRPRSGDLRVQQKVQRILTMCWISHRCLSCLDDARGFRIAGHALPVLLMAAMPQKQRTTASNDAKYHTLGHLIPFQQVSWLGLKTIPLAFTI